MNVNALAAAPAALEWLAQTKSARILNVFDRACNLVNPPGEVLSLVTGERGMTPFALLIPAASPLLLSMLLEFSPVRVEGQRLHVGPLIIDWSPARSWTPAPDWDALRYAFADGAFLAGVAQEAVSLPTRGSLLELFRAAPAGRTLTPPLKRSPLVPIKSGRPSLSTSATASELGPTRSA